MEQKIANSCFLKMYSSYKKLKVCLSAGNMQNKLKKISPCLGTGYKHPFTGYHMFLYSELHSIKIIVEVPITGLKLTRQYKFVAVLAMLKTVR